MANLTGFPENDFTIIALAEYLSLLCFLIRKSSFYKSKIAAYACDNQNVATWIKYRKPKNRVAQYFTRIPNRFETEKDCAAFPRYISSNRNEFCDKLSRLEEDSACGYGASLGYQFQEVITMSKWFLTDRLRTRSLVLPTDPPGRAHRIMQFVEK